MPNTAARGGFMRLAPVRTIAVVRWKTSRSALLSLVVLSASACGNNRSVAPTPLAPSPSVTVTTVGLEGRVVDEHDQPVGGARITVLHNPGGRVTSATADDTGSFSLTVDWPSNWPGITVRVEREGYESADTHVQAAEASRVLINVYRSLTVSPGESIQTTLSLRSGDCGFEPFCRRAIVNAPSGKLVDVEVIPADGQEYAGLALRDQLFLGYNFPSRVTVSGGAEVWIVVRQLGRVSVVAADR